MSSKEPTFKGTAEVRITLHLELDGDTTSGDLAILRKAVAEHAELAVRHAIRNYCKAATSSWTKGVDSVETETVKLTIDWERGES